MSIRQFPSVYSWEKFCIAVDRVKWKHVQTITMEHRSRPNSQCRHQQPLDMQSLQSLLSIALDLLATLRLLGSIRHLMAKDNEIIRMLKPAPTTRYFYIDILQAFYAPVFTICIMRTLWWGVHKFLPSSCSHFIRFLCRTWSKCLWTIIWPLLTLLIFV